MNFSRRRAHVEGVVAMPLASTADLNEWLPVNSSRDTSVSPLSQTMSCAPTTGRDQESDKEGE